MSHSLFATPGEILTIPENWWNARVPIEIDLGCHKGAFLAAMARAYPGVRFLGVERQAGRTARALAKIRREGLANAWAVQSEGLGGLLERVPAHSIAVIHVSFPDPWPKRRHQSRRLVNGRFLADAWSLLVPGGALRLMTDDAPYFKEMREAVAADGRFSDVPWDDGRFHPPTEFQRKFALIGKPVYRAALRTVSTASA